MKKQLIGTFTAMILISTLGTLPSQAQEVEAMQQTGDDNESVTTAAGSDNSAEAKPIASEEVVSEEFAFEPSRQESNTLTPSEATVEPEPFQAALSSPRIIQVNAHPLDQRSAATLYVRNIPVLTFMDTATETPVANGAENNAVAPEVLAADMGHRIEQIDDAETISVRWDTEQEHYAVMVDDSELVALGNGVTLPDSTDNLAEDALQVANRLRRLVGGADPITEIEGRPEPTVAIISHYTGMASWYGPGFHGRRSASGEVFNQNALTAAHRTLPFGTQVRVTNINNGRQVIVRINDRGPFSGHRVIDLSAGAARSIGLTASGVGPVRLEVLGR